METLQPVSPKEIDAEKRTPMRSLTYSEQVDVVDALFLALKELDKAAPMLYIDQILTLRAGIKVLGDVGIWASCRERQQHK